MRFWQTLGARRPAEAILSKRFSYCHLFSKKVCVLLWIWVDLHFYLHCLRYGGSLLNLPDTMNAEKALRDLFWVAQSPLLMAHGSAELIQRQLSVRLQEVFNNDRFEIIAQLPRFDSQLPLGRWFESLLDFGLRLIFGDSRVHKGVTDERGGELDFVVSNDESVFHIECAVKCYLHRIQVGQGLAAFVGPAARDRLDLKYRKMMDIQLCRAVPSALLAGRPLSRVLWMSGCIFYPQPFGSHTPAGLADPAVLNRGHLRGVFGAADEIFGKLKDGDLLIELPPSWWITSLDGFKAECLDLFSRFSGHSDRARMVAQVRRGSDRVLELRRGFVT